MMRRARLVTLFFAALMICTMPSAFAAVSLPYGFSFTGLSGGSSGVTTPNFDNTGGVLCVTINNISLEQNTQNQVVDKRVRFSLKKDVNWGTDPTEATVQFDLGQTGTKCFASVPTSNHYVHIQKVVFQQGITFSGRGTVGR